MNKNLELLEQTGNDAIVHEELFKVEPIEGSPFNILSRDGQHSLVFGRFALTEKMDSKDEVLAFLRVNYWNIICTLATIIAEDVVLHHEKNRQNF